MTETKIQTKHLDTLLDQNTGPVMLDDSPLSGYLARQLNTRYCFAPGLGWFHWTGKHWKPESEDAITEVVQDEFVGLFRREARTADNDRRKRLASLLNAGKIRAVKQLLRGLLLREANEFDSLRYAHLLNAQNGVVDLRTGELRPHDPDLMFTRVTACDYVPGATHRDWDEALQALPDEETREWMQYKLGQAITGLPPTDDILPILQGDGENGKSTVLACRYALGTFAGAVPDRVVVARPSDHPTELMTLRGLRFAILEELPEAVLSVRRLKAILGTPQITARFTGQDNVTWDATHTLVVSTNYRPRVVETDHGTWRRLALVNFPYRFRRAHQKLERDEDRYGTEGLRERLQHGKEQREAALAWMVEGAVRVYDGGDEQHLPGPSYRVRQDTAAWRGTVDLIQQFIEESLVFEEGAVVLSSDMFEEFEKSISSSGHREWSDQVFHERFLAHELVRDRPFVKKERAVLSASFLRRQTLSRRWEYRHAEPPKGRRMVWLGVRFRTPQE